MVGVARRRLGCAARPARVDGRGDRRRTASVRGHRRRRVGRAARRLGAHGSPHRNRAAVHGGSRPHVLRSPAFARRRRRDRDGAARGRTPGRPERAHRPGRRRGHSRCGARLGRRLGIRAGCAAAGRAVPLRVDADALRSGVPGCHRCGDGRGGTRGSRRHLIGVACRIRLPRPLGVDRGLHGLRMASAEWCAERRRLHLRLRQPRDRRAARLAVRQRGRWRSRARGGRSHRRFGRHARACSPRAAAGGRAAARDARAIPRAEGSAGTAAPAGSSEARRPAPASLRKDW